MKNKTIYESELFWRNHPSAYVSMYMKYDWFKMSRSQFMSSYIHEYLTTKLEEKKKDILKVLLSIWSEMDGQGKYDAIAALCEGWHYTESINALIELNEVFKCRFIEKAIKSSYHLATGRNYDTNYLAAFGINPAI